MAFWNWSRTASNNATATGGTWAEGMAPSAVNDTARINASELACYRDDIAGAILTSGSNTAYTVASYSLFTSLSVLNGQIIAFSPHATNGAGPVLLNVDGLGQKPLRSAPGVELQAGTIIQGTPYLCLYNSSDGAFYLHGFYGNAYSVPVFGGMDFWDTIAPNSNFIFPAGQAISRTTYATAFARWGTTYGTGDGSTTFNVPDKTGRVSAMIEASAARLTSSFFGGNSTLLGAVGGLQSNNVILTHSHPNTLTDPGHVHTFQMFANVGSAGIPANANNITSSGNGTTNSATTGITINNANAGSASAHNIVQPTITCNYILRII